MKLILILNTLQVRFIKKTAPVNRDGFYIRTAFRPMRDSQPRCSPDQTFLPLPRSQFLPIPFDALHCWLCTAQMLPGLYPSKDLKRPPAESRNSLSSNSWVNERKEQN